VVQGRSQGGTDGDGGDHRSHVGLEEVGTHPCRIPYIVPDVIGDHPRIPGVVFRDPGLHLAHQVRPDIRALGVDSSTDAGKKSNGTGSHGESVDDLRVLGEEVEQADSGHPQGGDGNAHHRPPLEGDGQRPRCSSFYGALGGTDGGSGGAFKSDEPGQHGAAGSGEEGQAGVDGKETP